MRAVIIGLIFAAVILAGGTAYLLRSYLTSQEAEFASRVPKAPTNSVMVAAADLPTGTVINAKNIEWQPWPKDAIQEGFLVQTPNDNPLNKITADKHVTRYAFTKGEPITEAKLYKSDDPGFLRGSLKPGMRAVAVKSSAESSASGFILPSDRVDILLTHGMVRRAMDQQVTEKPQTIIAMEHTSETILENLRVLAVDQKVNEFEGGAVVAKTVLLEVTPKQAEIINTAKNMGKLSLVLRSAEEPDKIDGEHPRRPFTTDVEVSPILSSFDELMSNPSGGYLTRGGDILPKGPQNADEYADGANQDAANAEPEPDWKPQPAPAPVPAYRAPVRKADKPKITVYRGAGASGTTETPGAANDAGVDEDAVQ